MLLVFVVIIKKVFSENVQQNIGNREDFLYKISDVIFELKVYLYVFERKRMYSRFIKIFIDRLNGLFFQCGFF